MNQLAYTFGIIGNVISLMVYFAPMPTFCQIYQRKSTEGFQSIPYVTSLFSSLFWIYYAVIKTNSTMLITINSTGCLIQITYICLYIFYATRDTMMQMLTMVVLPNTIVFILIIVLTQLLMKGGERTDAVGWICMFFSLLVYVSPLCIVGKVIRTKSVKYIPFLLSLSLTISAVVWFLYGILQNDYSIVILNMLGSIFGILQLMLYFMYKNAKENGDERREEIIAIEDDRDG
ncbi:bidirectional sugar transporter SWEET14 [Olea europaea subsp. europaea]|uniref:Bidirectional sugar transporter SWEET n=1 Tax=Olea europaea subsp. europaea TaxID=158383 RepID=A0A8S0TD90_OLEEU|nr:bidirectional sugar transporter SWEET14 [Olea europaea subsp. europaea]